jgi:uncharacterized protein (TIGR03435 family)
MRSAVFAACLLTAAVAARAQTPQQAFEVASVKQNKAGPGSPQRIGFVAGDRVSFTNVILLALIQTAYDTAEIIGGPDWIGKQGQPNWDVDRFDVAAKASAPASRDELKAMLRMLLAERFKLVAHTEARSEPVWALVLARRDGRLGSHLRAARASCAELRAGWQPKTPGEPDPCGTRSFATALMTGHMDVHGLALDQLGILAMDAGRRPVVNKTGLTGFFDWDLTWTPQRFLQGGVDRDRFPDINPDGPSVFTALEEQLGLKLESQKGESTVLVIDHVERPSEN